MFETKSRKMADFRLPIGLKVRRIMDMNCMKAAISKYDFLLLPQIGKLSLIRPYTILKDQGSIVVAKSSYT